MFFQKRRIPLTASTTTKATATTTTTTSTATATTTACKMPNTITKIFSPSKWPRSKNYKKPSWVNFAQWISAPIMAILCQAVFAFSLSLSLSLFLSHYFFVSLSLTNSVTRNFSTMTNIKSLLQCFEGLFKQYLEKWS